VAKAAAKRRNCSEGGERIQKIKWQKVKGKEAQAWQQIIRTAKLNKQRGKSDYHHQNFCSKERVEGQKE